MGSETTFIKPRYDISMSRRTRKPLNFQKDHHQIALQKSSSLKSAFAEAINAAEDHKSTAAKNGDTAAQESDNKMCLKQLIESRNSLGQHFTKDEKQQQQQQLQLVIKQPEDSVNGVKLRKMVTRYAKVLSHMIKLKRKKQVLQLAK